MNKGLKGERKAKSRTESGGTTAAPVHQDLAEAGLDLLSAGHQPGHTLSPQDQTLFRAFQSNLLSLVSHELRTPLMGILNSLSMLEASEAGELASEFTATELIAMARRNAQRLQQTLSALLDLVSMESGTFHVRLRETELPKLVRSRVTVYQGLLRDHEMKVELEEDGDPLSITPLLADPQKLGRAVDLCLQSLVQRACRGSLLLIRISSCTVVFRFRLEPGREVLWQEAWSQGLMGFEGGVASPGSAFSGTLQSEQGFLSRMEDGLGSEFVLIHEIMRRHQGVFHATLDESDSARGTSARMVTMVLEFPRLASMDGLRAVMASRTELIAPEQGALGSVALGLVDVPEGSDVEAFCAQVKKCLFRASDAVYPLPDQAQVALVLDDCKTEDAPRLIARIGKNLGKTLRFGVASCPGDGLDPSHLIDLALQRLKD